MFIKKTDFDALKEKFKEQLHVVVTKDARRGFDPGDGADGSEPFSISKYLRGAMFGNWHQADLEKRAFQKAADYTTDSGGRAGFLVPEELDREVIPRLTAKSVVRQMGVMVVPMGKRLSRDYTGVDSGPTISWGTEGGTIDQDDSMDLARLNLQTSKAVCRLRLSRELIEQPGVDADAVVMDELTRELAVEEDRVLLRGLGGTQPLGIYSEPRIHSTDLSGSIDQDDLTTAALQIEESNSEVTGFVSCPAIRNKIRALKDAEGRPLLAIGGFGGTKELLDAPQLYGRPFRVTTAIPKTGYPDSNESFIVAANWADLLIGDGDLRIESSTHADWNADLVSIKMVKRIGKILRHAESFCVIKGVTTN